MLDDTNFTVWSSRVCVMFISEFTWRFQIFDMTFDSTARLHLINLLIHKKPRGTWRTLLTVVNKH